MLSLRNIFRLGLRLSFAAEPANLRQLPSIGKQKLNNYQETFKRTNANLSEPQQEENEEARRKKLGKIDKKMKLVFTCKRCNTRNSKIISKLAYQKGVILVRCDGCKNNHLIADNLGWFTDRSKGINIEVIMAKKGETVRKVLNDKDGYIEAVPLTEEQLPEINEKVETESETSLKYEKVETPKKT